LRTYFRVCADSFALNEIKAASRKKRGGEVTHVALDFSAAEDELRAQTIDPAAIPSPESLEEFFEKEWIRSLFLPPSLNCGDSAKHAASKKLSRSLKHTISTAKKIFRTRIWPLGMKFL